MDQGAQSLPTAWHGPMTKCQPETPINITQSAVTDSCAAGVAARNAQTLLIQTDNGEEGTDW